MTGRPGPLHKGYQPAQAPAHFRHGVSNFIWWEINLYAVYYQLNTPQVYNVW